MCVRIVGKFVFCSSHESLAIWKIPEQAESNLAQEDQELKEWVPVVPRPRVWIIPFQIEGYFAVKREGKGKMLLAAGDRKGWLVYLSSCNQSTLIHS